MSNLDEIRARWKSGEIVTINHKNMSQALKDHRDLLAHIDAMQPVVGQAQGLYGDVEVQGECRCDPCKMKRALDKMDAKETRSMDRYKTVAREYLKGKAGVHQMTLEIEVKQLAEYLRKNYPDEPESLKSQIERLAAELYDRAGDGGESEGAIDCAIRVIREYRAKQPGRCGECRWWTEDNNDPGYSGPGEFHCARCCNPESTQYAGAWTCADMTCPRFERRADKYEELAREYCGNWNKGLAPSLADFLRERVTVREGE